MVRGEGVGCPHVGAEIEAGQFLERRDGGLELLDLVEGEVFQLFASRLERLGQLEVDERRLIRDERGRV